MKAKVTRIQPEIKVKEGEAIQVPAQINLFTGEEEPVRYPVETEFDEEEIEIQEGLTLVKSGDTSQLIVSGFGASLSKVSERLTVKLGKKDSQSGSAPHKASRSSQTDRWHGKGARVICHHRSNGRNLNTLIKSGGFTLYAITASQSRIMES